VRKRRSTPKSFESSPRYYACFGKTAGFRQTITAENAKVCPDVKQYVGKVVNGVDVNVVIGGYRFSNDATLMEPPPPRPRPRSGLIPSSRSCSANGGTDRPREDLRPGADAARLHKA
jgi:hypothetical protein